MLILNEIVRDARVLREAEALATRYDVRILGLDRRKMGLDPVAFRRHYGVDMRWAKLRLSSVLPRNVVGYGLRYTEAAIGMIARGAWFRPDVIHAHEDSALPIALAIRTFTRAKIIYDAHELYRESGVVSFMPWRDSAKFETWAMRRCSAIIACNRYRASIMKEAYGAPFLPDVVQNVPATKARVASDHLRKLVAAKNPRLKRICLHQGGMNATRGIDVLIRALPLLSPDICLVLVGDGAKPYVEGLDKLADELGVADRYFRLPAVDYDALFAITCSADIGIVIYQNTCRNNEFCAPNKLYEYAAAGLPVAGSDQAPIRDFVTEHQSGVVFPADSPDALARGIGHLLSSSDVYEKYRNAALNAAQIACWEKESQKLLQIYERVLTS